MILTDFPAKAPEQGARRHTDFACRLIVELGSQVVSESELPHVMSVPEIHANVTRAIEKEYEGQYTIAGIYLARGTARVTLLSVKGEGYDEGLVKGSGKMLRNG